MIPQTIIRCKLLAYQETRLSLLFFLVGSFAASSDLLLFARWRGASRFRLGSFELRSLLFKVLSFWRAHVLGLQRGGLSMLSQFIEKSGFSEMRFISLEGESEVQIWIFLPF